MSSLTESDITSEPKKKKTTIDKLREPKIANMAAFDWIATAIVALGISKVSDVHFIIVFVVMVIIAIVVHIATGTPTMLNHYLGINTKEEVLATRK